MLSSAYKVRMNDGMMVIRDRIMSLSSEETSVKAKNKFEKYKKDGIIQSEFEETKWILSDEKHKTEFDFEIPEIDFYKAKPLYKRTDLITMLKNFLVVEMGCYQLKSLYEALQLIKKILVVTDYMTRPEVLIPEKKEKDREKITLLHRIHGMPWCIRFFDHGALPGMAEIAEVLNDDSLERFYESPGGYGKRNLAEFRSYFLFGRYLDRYWKEMAMEEKLHFYPVYIFYHLTMILPLRVTEFCVLPANPIRKDHAGYHLKVRRSNLKGRKKYVGYRLDKDFDLYEYAITEDLAALFLEYEKLTRNDIRTEGCFWTTAYRLQEKIPETNRAPEIFKGVYINDLIDELYAVFEERYDTVTISIDQYKSRKAKGETWYPDEIVCIRAGDTRHIAAIGLVANGCNPMILREFMGHENIQSAEHYYSNVKEYVDSYIVMAYERMPKEYRHLRFQDAKRKKRYAKLGIKPEETDYGLCYCENDQEECIRVNMKCELCKYSIARDMTTEERRKQMDEELKKRAEKVTELFRMRTMDGRIEEVHVAVAELQKAVTERKLWLLKLANIYGE